MWPVVPHRITLRVCRDLDWQVTVRCPKCRVSSMLPLDKLASGAMGDVSIERLFARGVFKCSKVQYGCNGTPAASVEVSAMDVGILKTVARWEARSSHRAA